MQYNVECRLPEEDVILKEPPSHDSPPSEGARLGGAGGLERPFVFVLPFTLEMLQLISKNVRGSFLEIAQLQITKYFIKKRQE